MDIDDIDGREGITEGAFGWGEGGWGEGAGTSQQVQALDLPIMNAVPLQRIRDSEREIQRVFDAWTFGPGAYRTLPAGAREYVVVGCPDWLTARRRSSLPRTLTAALGYDFRPDLVWEGDDRSFVLELKSAQKYEPIALPEVLHHAQAIEKRARDVGDDALRRIVPVMVTQYNTWLREALEYLFSHGLDHAAIHYLEFEALHVPRRSPGEPDRRVLWLDEPFAPWTRADPPAAVEELAHEPGQAHPLGARWWYRIDATSTWVATEREQTNAGRPLSIVGPYVMLAPAGKGAFVRWCGTDADGGSYSLCDDGGLTSLAHVATPRLAHPEQIVDFQMEVGDEAGSHA